MNDYVGNIERIDEGIAFVTIRASDGTIIEGEFPVEAFKDIKRRFILHIEPLPDHEVSEEREREIIRQIEELLPD